MLKYKAFKGLPFSALWPSVVPPVVTGTPNDPDYIYDWGWGISTPIQSVGGETFGDLFPGSSGALPPGIMNPGIGKFDFQNNLITGTPTQLGTFSARVVYGIRDQYDGASPSYRVFTYKQHVDVEFQVLDPQPPSIKNGQNFNGVVGRPFACGAELENESLQPVTNWSVSGLPSWASFDPDTGGIFGTPSSAGSHIVTVTATGPLGVSTESINIQIAQSLFTLQSNQSLNGEVGRAFSSIPQFSGLLSYWKASNLPAGLQLNSQTGEIYGTPRNKEIIQSIFTVPLDDEVQTFKSIKNLGIALLKSGKVVLTGLKYPAYSVPTGLQDVVDIAISRQLSGYNHPTYYAVKSDGTLVIWGADVPAKTNKPTNISGVARVFVSDDGRDCIVLKKDKTLAAWGAESFAPYIPANLSDVIDVHLKNGYAYAKKSNGTWVGWGWFNSPPILSSEDYEKSISFFINENGTVKNTTGDINFQNFTNQLKGVKEVLFLDIVGQYVGGVWQGPTGPDAYPCHVLLNNGKIKSYAVSAPSGLNQVAQIFTNTNNSSTGAVTFNNSVFRSGGIAIRSDGSVFDWVDWGYKTSPNVLSNALYSPFYSAFSRETFITFSIAVKNALMYSGVLCKLFLGSLQLYPSTETNVEIFYGNKKM